MAKFAEGTKTSVATSRAEIEKTLTRYGATSFAIGQEPERVAVMFVANARQVRFVVPMPSIDDRDITHTYRQQSRTKAQRQTALDNEVRRRWRALAMAIKAKLEVVATGIATFEEEFAAHVVLPDGRTAGEVIVPAIAEAYETGTIPPLLGLPAGQHELGPG